MLRRVVFQGRLGQQPCDGAKIATRSQEIPSGALLVLPISQDVAGGPRGLVFSPGWYGGNPWGLVLHQAGMRVVLGA